MNQLDAPARAAAREAMESRFARRIAVQLTAHAENAGADIGERLRFARENALASARRKRAGRDAEQRVGVSASGAASLGLNRSPWWLRLASLVPLAVLAAGLLLIQSNEVATQISVAAEIDAALLGDDLPITAYRDAGFAEFLKTPPLE